MPGKSQTATEAPVSSMKKAPVAETPAPTTSNQSRPQKPDDAAFQKQLDEINQKINALKLKQSETQSNLSGGDTIKGSFQARRQELRSELDAAIKQRNEINDTRQKLIEKLKSIQNGMKKRAEEIKSSKDKLGVKNVDEIDSQINALERQLQAGQLKLYDEKRVVAEISNLKKAKKVLEGFSTQQNSVVDEKKEMDDIRKKLDELDPQKSQVQTLVAAKKAALDQFESERKEKMGSFTDLINLKNSIKAEMDAEYDKLKKLRADNKAAKDEYFQFMRQERERKKQQFEQRRQAEKDARLHAQAQAEREAAEFPAFTEEINTCTNLIAFFQQIVDPTKSTSAKPDAVATPAATNIRQVEGGVPEGAVLLKKKDDREEDYLVMNKKKGKKNNAAPAAEKPKTLKLDLVMMDQLVQLKVDIPVAVTELEKTIEALEAKKKYFYENQAAKTEENKRKAEEKIALLKTKMEENGSLGQLADSTENVDV